MIYIYLVINKVLKTRIKGSTVKPETTPMFWQQALKTDTATLMAGQPATAKYLL